MSPSPPSHHAMLRYLVWFWYSYRCHCFSIFTRALTCFKPSGARRYKYHICDSCEAVVFFYYARRLVYFLFTLHPIITFIRECLWCHTVLKCRRRFYPNSSSPSLRKIGDALTAWFLGFHCNSLQVLCIYGSVCVHPFFRQSHVELSDENGLRRMQIRVVSHQVIKTFVKKPQHFLKSSQSTCFGDFANRTTVLLNKCIFDPMLLKKPHKHLPSFVCWLEKSCLISLLIIFDLWINFESIVKTITPSYSLLLYFVSICD